MKSLDFLFPAFKDSRRQKPREMLFVAHDAIPLSTTLITAAQHALVVLMLVVYTVIAGKEIGLSDAELRGFVALEIVVMGAITLLQGLGTRFSSGHLIVHNPSVVSMATFIVVVTSFGIGAAAGAFMLSGIVVMVLGRFLPRLQTVFPPEVTGVLLVLLGLSLIEGGVERYTGLNGSDISISSVIVASVSLGGIVAFSVWGSPKLRVFAVAIGMAAGLIIATLFGQFGDAQIAQVAAQPLFSFPLGSYELPTPTLVISAAIPLIIIEIISAVDSIGTGVAIDKMNNEKWRRPDLAMISRLVTGHGICVFLNGLTGTLSCGTSSANLGLAHATGVAARKVGVFTGIILIIAAFLPPVSTFITLIPQPVMGAIIVYTAGYMLVAGMQLILSRMLNSRRMFMIGLSTTIGAAVILMPELTADLPKSLKPIFGSGLTVGVMAAVILNMIFRIGVSRHAEILLDGHHSGRAATNFLEECGADWGARPDVILRGGIAVGEALEALHMAELIEGQPNLKAMFDEYKLVLSLEYPGRQLTFVEGPKLDLQALMDDEGDGDTALDNAMSNISGALIKNLADKVTSSEHNGVAELHLQFTH